MAISGGYIPAQASALTVNSGKSTAISVKGLQGLTLPLGFTQQTSEASVIGTRIATKYATGAAYEDITTNYYFAPGDESQTYLMDCARNATRIRDMWFWLDSTDFVALDLVSDPGGYVMIGTFSSPAATKNEIYSGSISIIIGGSHILFNKHAVATTAVFSLTAGGAGVSAAATSADTTNFSFVDLGFKEGDTVIITGVTWHYTTLYYGKVDTVTHSKLTFKDGFGNIGTLPTTAAAATIKIHGGVPIEVTSTYI